VTGDARLGARVAESRRPEGSDSRRAPAWIAWLPEADRRLYERAGYGGGEWIDGRAALLAIDVTQAFAGDELPTSCGERAARALPRIRLLLDAFRSAALPVVFTRADERAQAALGRATKRGGAAAGNDFVEGVDPQAGEWVCEKARASAFYGTPLEAYLRRQSVARVVVCGGSTSGCVRASCVDAFSAGFQVTVAEDACFDRAELPHLANLFDLHAKYATVLSAGAIAAQVR
jgi:nicotinamidase-related amidase